MHYLTCFKSKFWIFCLAQHCFCKIHHGDTCGSSSIIFIMIYLHCMVISQFIYPFSYKSFLQDRLWLSHTQQIIFQIIIVHLSYCKKRAYLHYWNGFPCDRLWNTYSPCFPMFVVILFILVNICHSFYKQMQASKSK